jgi:hypothetical protein
MKDRRGEAMESPGHVRSQTESGNEGTPAEGSSSGNEGKKAFDRINKIKRIQKEADARASASANPVNHINPIKTSVVERVAKKIERRRARRSAPRIDSLLDFLLHHARVKSGAGYAPYHFAGREALRGIVERLDQILASGEADASLAICGGAQFGKTVLMLNLLAYLVAVRFRNVGYYLPDDDLVQGLVDGKLRPDVLDQIPWLARLIAVGKTLTATGRATNRKGAFLCTDGTRTALAFMRGLGKIPTSFSMDVVVQDEKDDLPEEHARFLAGRMTASNLRLSLLIGTQRYHGAGQNLAFTEGTQHIGLVRCTGCGARVNPETAWPGVCRLVGEGRPSDEWLQLTAEGHFSAPIVEEEGNFDRINKIKRIEAQNREDSSGQSNSLNHINPIKNGLRISSIAYSPGQKYALCCPGCGGLLDREHPEWHAEAPEREKLRQWSYRISQLLIPAIELEQIVAAWQRAVRDADHMTVFCTDRLALPKATTQSLTPVVLEAARGDYTLGDGVFPGRLCDSFRVGPAFCANTGGVARGLAQPPATALPSLRDVQKSGEPISRTRPYHFSFLSSNFVRYAGLDLGDQCWFVARAVDSKAPHDVRLLWVEPMAAERVRSRVPELFRELNLRALCVDAGPLRDLARDLVFQLNRTDGTDRTNRTDGTVRWNEAAQKWRSVRAMAVEFTQREGAGLRHKLGLTQEGRAYPLLAAHRDETIERVVQELLPPGVGDRRLIENPDGTAASAPTQRFSLPAKTEATREVLDLYERHLLAGARQERDGKARRYLDKCENHFLLATAYAALAELIAPVRDRAADALPLRSVFRALPGVRRLRARSVLG